MLKSQYERFPYPAVPLLALPDPDDPRLLALREPVQTLRPRILIAGCGTGQQSIETALQFPGARILAIDLSLTSLGYTATQYALLTSALTWTGKTLKGFSGEIVETLQHGRAGLDGYALFYLLSGAIGLPAILLCLVLAMRRPRPGPA